MHALWSQLVEPFQCSRDVPCVYAPVGVHPRTAQSAVEDDFTDDEHHLERQGSRTSVESSTTDSLAFHLVAGAMITANTLVITMEAIYIQNQEVWKNLQGAEVYFTIFYVLELSWRLIENGLTRFFCGSHDWVWNWFDLIITVSCVADELYSMFHGDHSGRRGSDAAVSRTARLFRVMRILRPFRALRFLSEVDYVLLMTMRHLAKLSVIVALVIFVSAIVATNMLWDCDEPEVVAMFGDFWISLWTMFQLMTLDSWIELTDRVIAVRPDMLVFFGFYIFVASIAVMTLVPAIFIELGAIQREQAMGHPIDDSPFSRQVSEAAPIDRRNSFFGFARAAERGSFTRQSSPKQNLLSEIEMEQRLQKTSKRPSLSGARRECKVQLLRHLFRMSVLEKTGVAPVAHMQQALQDEGTLQTLRLAGLDFGESDLHDLRLILFHCWEKRQTGCRGVKCIDAQISEAELLDGVDLISDDESQALVWRISTSTRMQLRDFHESICAELEATVARFDGVREQTGLLQNLQTEVTRLFAHVSGALSHLQDSFDARMSAPEIMARSTTSHPVDTGSSLAKMSGEVHQMATCFELDTRALTVTSARSAVDAANNRFCELQNVLRGIPHFEEFKSEPEDVASIRQSAVASPHLEQVPEADNAELNINEVASIAAVMTPAILHAGNHRNQDEAPHRVPSSADRSGQKSDSPERRSLTSLPSTPIQESSRSRMSTASAELPDGKIFHE